MESTPHIVFDILMTPMVLIGLVWMAFVYWALFIPEGSSNKPEAEKSMPRPPAIVPVGDDFDWRTCKAPQYVPFKNGEYRLNLGLRKMDPNDLLDIEETYLDRTNLGAARHFATRDVCCGCHESAVPALRETYDYLFHFLLRRYPQYFEITEDGNIRNKIRKETVPGSASHLSPEQITEILVRNIEEDVLILQKDQPEDSDANEEYMLRAAVFKYPNGFSPAEKLNKKLVNVHGPVPGYKERLQSPMNKFFNRLKAYEYFFRVNWGFQAHGKLCVPGDVETEQDPEKLDFNKVFYRSEKQVFTRLPSTGSNLMLIRTYVIPATELRADPSIDKERLCGAIDGIKGPIANYKGRTSWGEPVKAYLSGKTDGLTKEVYEYKFTE